MKTIMGLASYAVAMTLALMAGEPEAEAGAGCQLTVTVQNGFKRGIVIKKLELGGPAGWTTKWEGERGMKSGGEVTKTLTTGTPCKDKMGNPLKWNLRFTRKNDVSHLCSNVPVSSKARLGRGGACVVSDG